MTTSLVRLRKGWGRLGLVTATLSLFVLVLPWSYPSRADTSPPAGVPSTVSVDPLPTTQIDGVVWSQVVIGNTVYAGGQFTTARPAGAAPGTQTVRRSNLLAYDIRTGKLVTSFAPVLNGQVLALAASPDHTRLFVGGDFTKVGSSVRNRLAAFDVATGALTGFAPSLNASVRALTTSASRVYAGGSFTSVNGVARSRLAAFSPTSGALLTWRPAASSTVTAMVVAPGGASVVIGGRFTTLAGHSAYGLGAVNASTGASMTFLANATVRDAGSGAAITSLSTDGVRIYGTGYVFGTGGNFEGTFAAQPSNGALVWLADCHGDTYSAYPRGGVVYTVGHAHACSTIGGFPETSPRSYHRALALTTAATGKVTTNTDSHYTNFAGKPAPSLLTWFPTLTAGTVTGQTQAAWSVTGTSSYVVLGGEFPSVGGRAQQGLVRFAVSSLAPNKVGPAGGAADFGLVPTVVAPTQVRLGWRVTWDPDNAALTYRLLRTEGTTTLTRYQHAFAYPFWRLALGGYTDTVVPGHTYTYQVTATDPFGNVARSATVDVTMPN